jgi:hypothetical protein
MRISVATMLILLGACEGDPADGGTDGDGTIPPPPVTTDDTGWPPGQVSHMHIWHQATDNRTRAYAMFSQNDFSFPNVAQCAIEGTICLPPFPDPGDPPTVVSTTQFDQSNVSTVFAGFEVELGPYPLNYVEQPESGFGSYSADVSGQPLPVGWIGVSWGGAWKPYEGTEDLYVSPPIDLISPPAGAHVRFQNGEDLILEWLPTGEGDVTITVVPEVADILIFGVEDDGYHAFDVDTELGLVEDTEEVTFILSRWNTSELRKYGHVIELTASSDASFTSTYNNIGSRTRINPADKCTEAQGSLPLGTGNYWGFLDAYENDLDPIPVYPQCPLETINSDARGKEALVKIELDPYESVNVDYNTFAPLSAATYLLEECDDINTCIIAADVSDNANDHEFVNYFNNSDDRQTLYLGLDSSDKDNGVFTLDMTVSELADPEMYDVCADAKDPAAVTTGAGTWSYFETFTAYTADSNPGAGGCTGTSLGGNEAILVLEIPTMMTASILVTMPGADPGIYLLYDCDNPSFCPVGSDASLGPEEKFTYENVSADTERVYLVVDSKSGLQPFFVSVTTQ